jgi:hypothetical protein
MSEGSADAAPKAGPVAGVSVVITLDGHNTSPYRALESVVDAASHVRDIHFELCGEADEKAVLAHPGVANLITKFGADAVFWHPGFLDVQALRTQAVVRIQPDHVMLPAALLTLKKDLRRYPGCTHFALMGGLNLRPAGGTFFDTLWYGFLVPLLVIDTMASWITLGQHARTVDVRAQLIYRTWPGHNRPPARPSWWRWWFGTRTCWTRAATHMITQAPGIRGTERGLPFVARTIKQHAHCRPWAIWWLAIYALHWVFVAILVSLALAGESTGVAALWSDGRFTGTSFAFLIAFVAYCIWSRAVSFPYYGEVVALFAYPVYLILSPLVFLYGRWHTSQSTLEAVQLLQEQEYGSE